jgi:hypothetical protein
MNSVMRPIAQTGAFHAKQRSAGSRLASILSQISPATASVFRQTAPPSRALSEGARHNPSRHGDLLPSLSPEQGPLTP